MLGIWNFGYELWMDKGNYGVFSWEEYSDEGSYLLCIGVGFVFFFVLGIGVRN